MTDVEYMDKLNHVDTLREIVGKLPFELQRRWRKHSFTLWTSNNRSVRFDDIISFVQFEADVLGDPLFGAVTRSKPHQKIEGFKPRAFNIATQATTDPTDRTERICHYWGKDNHKTNECSTAKLSISERKEYAQQKWVCFGCLSPGHTSKGCLSRLDCKACHRKHPTMLHITTKSDEPLGTTKLTSNSISVKTNRASKCQEAICLAIVPVIIKIKGPTLKLMPLKVPTPLPRL